MDLPRLLTLGFTRGKLKYTGPRFHERRQETLRRWSDFTPDGVEAMQRNRIVKFRMIRGQLALIRESWTDRPRHLSLGDRGIAYVRLPRAGSTQLSRLFLQAKYPDIRDKTVSDEDVNFLTDVNLDDDHNAHQSETIYFTIVRHPLARLASVYRRFFEESTDDDFLYTDYLFGILRRSDSFPDFVRNVGAIPDGLKDQHLRPQTRLLRWYHRRGIPVRIFRLEAPDGLKDFLAGHGISWQHFPPTRYASYYDPATAAVASQIYSDDLTVFGYGSERF